MDQFLDDLHFFCTENTAPPKAPDYEANMKALCTMEEQLKQAIGRDFFRQYDEAIHQVQQRELLESFRAGLRFGADFALEVWGHSSQVSSPIRFQADFTSPQA